MKNMINIILLGSALLILTASLKELKRIFKDILKEKQNLVQAYMIDCLE